MAEIRFTGWRAKGLPFASLLVLLSAACGTQEAPPAVDEERFGGLSQSLLDRLLETPERGDPEAAAPHLERARRRLARQDVAGALAACEEALAADPACREALLIKAQLLLQPSTNREPTLALEAYRLARLLDPEDCSALLGEAWARCSLGDDESARVLFDQLAARLAGPDQSLTPQQEGLRQRGEGLLRYRAEELDRALEHFDHALACVPRDRRTMARRAETLERMRRFEEAEKQIRAAIELRPEKSKNHFLRQRLLRRLGRQEEADRELAIYELLLPFDDDISRRFQSEHERRIDLRRKLVQAYPEFERARHLLVAELIAGAELTEAVEVLTAILDRQADDVQALYLLGKTQARRGDLEAARETAARLERTGRAPVPALRDLYQEIERGGGGGE